MRSNKRDAEIRKRLDHLDAQLQTYHLDLVVAETQLDALTVDVPDDLVVEEGEVGTLRNLVRACRLNIRSTSAVRARLQELLAGDDVHPVEAAVAVGADHRRQRGAES